MTIESKVKLTNVRTEALMFTESADSVVFSPLCVGSRKVDIFTEVCGALINFFFSCIPDRPSLKLVKKK